MIECFFCLFTDPEEKLVQFKPVLPLQKSGLELCLFNQDYLIM